MKTCNIGNTGDPLDSPQCFGAGSLRSSSEAENSRVSPSVNEDVGLRGAYIYWSVYIYLDRSFQKFSHRRTPRTAEGLFESLSFSYTYPIQPPPPPPQFLFFFFFIFGLHTLLNSICPPLLTSFFPIRMILERSSQKQVQDYQPFKSPKKQGPEEIINSLNYQKK